MSTSRPYQHIGVFFPYRKRDNEWRARVGSAKEPYIVNKNDGNDGFILCSKLGGGAVPPTVCVVQSLSTGELYVRKALGYPGHVPELPAEIRVSTWDKPRVGGDGGAVLSKKENATYFNQIVMWQQNGGAWAAFYKFCNGGSLQDFWDRYFEKGLRIPEHFIWHVMAELGEALAYQYFGRARGARPGQNQANWTRIYHADLWHQNIMVHYPRPGPGGRASKGNMMNAFPHIVIIDYGASMIDGDDQPASTRRGRGALSHAYEGSDDDNFVIPVHPWEDVYCYGAVLRMLTMAQIPSGAGIAGIEDVHGDRPTLRRLEYVNDYPGEPYSQLLLDTLAPFEVPDVNGAPRGMGGSVFDQTYINETPTIEHICDTILPIARLQVENWRNSAPQPGEKLAETLDVSWTKPAPVMPYRCDAPKTDAMTEAIWSIKQSLRFVDPPIQFRVLEMGPVAVAKPFGVTPTTALAGRPTFATDTWDDRHLRLQAAPFVHRDFEAKTAVLIAGFKRIFTHEGHRWNTGDPPAIGEIPSDDDAGSDHGGPTGGELEEDNASHRLLRRVNKRLSELQDEIASYSRKRKNIREFFNGGDLGPEADAPALPIPAQPVYVINDVVDLYYPDADALEWVGHEDPDF